MYNRSQFFNSKKGWYEIGQSGTTLVARGKWGHGMRQRLPPLTCNQACSSEVPRKQGGQDEEVRGSGVAKADRRQAVAVSTRMPCAQSGVSGIFPLLGPPSGALGRALPTEESAPEGHRRQKPPTHHSALGRASALRLECPRAQTWPPCPLGSLPHPPPHILPTAPASQPHAVFILPSLWPPANPSSTSTLTPSCSHLCSWLPRCSVSSHKHSVRNRQLWKF